MTLLKEHLWLAQVLGDAFNAPVNIVEMRQFLYNIKPAYTHFIFQVLRALDDSYQLTDTAMGLTDDIIGHDIDQDLTLYTENTLVNYMSEALLTDYINDGNIALDLDTETLYNTDHLTVEVTQGPTLLDTIEAIT